MKALWNETVLAASADTGEGEPSRHFPASSLQRRHLRAPDDGSGWLWNGTAPCCSGGKVDLHVLWDYPEAKAGAADTGQGRAAFRQDVEVTA